MDWQTGARDQGVAARKCPEMEHCEIHRLAVHTSCLSQGQKWVQVNTHIYTHAHGHQSLAYRKRYPTKRKIELGNMGTVICGNRVLWPGEKYSLEHTSSSSESKEEEASVLFI